VAARRVRVAQPGGVPVRVFERVGVWRGQGLYGGVGMAEGLGFNPKSERNLGRSRSGASCSSRTPRKG
jgi:hypothetical protein